MAADTELDEEGFADFCKRFSIGDDAELLAIARYAFEAPLPPSWDEHLDPDGRVYYSNEVTKRSTWDHPADETFEHIIAAVKAKDRSHGLRTIQALLDRGGRACDGWAGPYVGEDGNQYFHHVETGTSSWTHPAAEWSWLAELASGLVEAYLPSASLEPVKEQYDDEDLGDDVFLTPRTGRTPVTSPRGAPPPRPPPAAFEASSAQIQAPASRTNGTRSDRLEVSMGSSSDTSDQLEFTFGSAAIQSPNSPLNRLSGGRAPLALARGKVTIGSPGKVEFEADPAAAITTPVSFCSGGGMTDGASGTGTPESRAGAVGNARRAPDLDEELLSAAPAHPSSSMVAVTSPKSPSGKARLMVEVATGEVQLIANNGKEQSIKTR